MAEIVTIECFKGSHKLSKNCFTEADLQAFIDENEDYFLCMLLGQELKQLFEADLLNGVPQTPIYQAIYEKLCIDNNCCGCSDVCKCNYYSYGMKYMLTGLLYSQYILTDQYTHILGGTVSSMTEVSSKLSYENLSRASDMRWNESVESWKTIQEYIRRNKTDYPTYKGCNQKYSFKDVV